MLKDDSAAADGDRARRSFAHDPRGERLGTNAGTPMIGQAAYPSDKGAPAAN